MLAVLVASLAAAATPAGAAPRYDLQGGCYALKAGDRFVAKADGAYRLGGAGEPFRLQATTLGRYLLYGSAKDFLGPGASATAPSPETEWRIDSRDGGVTLTQVASGRGLAAARDGSLALGEATTFSLERAENCAVYPEADVNVMGEPWTGATPFGEVTGLLDSHLHLMAFEFIGGRARCGRPWHPYGITYAMVDCPDHEPGGAGAVMENVLSSGNPVGTHDTVGWPTFRDWPRYNSYTHEQAYYKGLERAWRSGLRVVVNLLVDNRALCRVYPYRKYDCSEMGAAKRELDRTLELVDYIDAQSGGPGKGWLRIARDPFEARRIVNEGKLALVFGIETSRLFECGVYDDVPECDREDVDRELERWHDLGVRSLQLVNKFDNAFSGVTGDGGIQGPIVNFGNKLETNRWWDMRTCTTEEGAYDKDQTTQGGGMADPFVAGVLQTFGPPGSVAPVYPPAPHCNARGLSDLGEYLIRRMMQKGMLFDPDHMSVVARKQAMAIVDAAKYPGVLSSHSWSSPDALPRIYARGGVVTPIGAGSKRFVEEWRALKAIDFDERYYFGLGVGTDVNGFHSLGGPRDDADKNPVQYPFKSFDGAVTIDRQRMGERVYDVNKDGMAHFGLLPDWLEDIRKLAGQPIVDDMNRGAEAYLQVWERAVGVPSRRCFEARRRFRRGGLAPAALGSNPEELLRSAGQPVRRPGRVWRFCGKGRDGRPAGRVTTVMTPRGRLALVASTGAEHTAFGVARGDRASRLRGVRRLGRKLRVRDRRFVYGVRRGKVRFVAVASKSLAGRPKRLRAYLRLAKLR